jgi:hypothetical protein
MHTQNLNFLKPLELPKRLRHDLPSTRFDDGLSTWEQLRGDELKCATPPNYDYYARVYREHMTRAWGTHDGAFMAEHLQDIDDQDAGTFDALGSQPARVLGVTARLLGWRLVPLARWAGVKLRRPDLPNYVENRCREWCATADACYRILARQKLTRINLESQVAIIRPLRNEARELEMRTLGELELYFRF